jgi:putative RNA 2'-phosphotransferase
MSKEISKKLCYVLRHLPDSIGIALDAAGWVAVDALLAALARSGTTLARAELERIVVTNDRRRFAFSADGSMIRAVQGHSTPVTLGHPAAAPPELLYHGTVARFLPDILRDGLKPGARHDVHLSPDEATARRVGARRGRPVILVIDAVAMHHDGHVFRIADNGVWLIPHVPPRYLRASSKAAR